MYWMRNYCSLKCAVWREATCRYLMNFSSPIPHNRETPIYCERRQWQWQWGAGEGGTQFGWLSRGVVNHVANSVVLNHHYVLGTVCSVYCVVCSVYQVRRTVCTVQNCMFCVIHGSVNCVVCTVQCIVCVVCTVYSVYCVLRSVYCVVLPVC